MHVGPSLSAPVEEFVSPSEGVCFGRRRRVSFLKISIDYKLRLCPICDSNYMGDEYHYFLNCKNYKLKNLKENFLKEILEINSCFSSLGKNDLFLYCISMNDKSLTNCTPRYIYELTKIFSDCTVCN